MAARDTRPFFLNLIRIRLPVPGVVSILHRISGVLMFVAIPFVVYLFEISLRNAEGFDQVAEILDWPLVKLALLLMIWSLVHHFLAGIRFLLTDFDIGLDKTASRRNAWLVLLLEVLVMLWVVVGMCS